jgi:hypothetical protein
MAEEERYLGGLSSSKLVKGVAGYGIHVTNQRIFGVRNLKALGSLMASMLVGAGATMVAMSLPSDESARAVAELEKNHDFVARKEDIARLELLKPGFVSNGYLVIISKSGKKTKIRFRGEKEFESIKALSTASCPEAVKLV